MFRTTTTALPHFLSNFSTSPVVYLLLVTLFLHLSQAAFIQPITSTPLRPFSVNENYTTDYSFAFNIPTPIVSKASIQVEFPSLYLIPSSCIAVLKIPEGSFESYPCEKTSPTQYLISMNQIITGDYYLVFENILNPTAYPASSNFKVRTYYNQDILIDSNEYFDAVPFLPTPLISNGATINNIGYTNVSLGSRFDFTFTLKRTLNTGDSIKFNFPVGFYFVKPACFHRNSGSYAPAEVLYNNRMVICQAFQYQMMTDVPQTVSIIGILNPDHAGYFHGFYLETMSGVFPNVLERINVLLPAQINAGTVSINITSESALISANTTHQLDLIFDNPVPIGKVVWIKLPTGFRYLAQNCTILRPLLSLPNGQITCGLAENGTGYILQGFAGISSGQLVSVELTTENPPASSEYSIQVFSFSPHYQAKIDEGFSSISIDSKYGSSKFFKSHALRYTRRLKHSETGPFEFTFFLNLPLPATTSTFEGRILINIFPQIPDPGNVTCFFYETIQAACTWDTSSSSNLTKLTVYTPSTAPYYRTEVPITITTEEAQGTAGITLPELIQRYKFYVYFYGNSSDVFQEIYYEDYVPDPITMTDDWATATFAPLQYEQDSYLRISWTNKYMDLGSNYFFQLDFNHLNEAWDFNLGWSALEWYQNYDLPCIVENLGEGIRCILRPGGELNTMSTIQVIGISSIPKSADGSTVLLHFPMIKFGTQGTANLRFGLYQNTPGESTLEIPIMVKDFQFLPHTAIVDPPMNALNVQLEPDSKVLTLKNLSLSLQSDVLPNFIIYTHPSLFGQKTSAVPCGDGSTCYIFSDPVNWIVAQPVSKQGSNVITSLPIMTPPYVDKYNFAAQTIKPDGTIDKQAQGSITITPGKPDMTFEPSSQNIEVNKNSLVLFDITFTTATPLPADGSIIIAFNNASILDTDDFYCKITKGLQALDAREIICERATFDSIKIYNLAAVDINTIIDVTVQPKTTTNPVIDMSINTYYFRNATKLVDSVSGSKTIDFLHINFTSASITNDRSNQIVRVGTTGILTVQMTPISSITYAEVIFGSGFGKTSTRDVPMCRVQGKRETCGYISTNPLTLAFLGATNDFVVGTPLNVSISTDYSLPRTKGVKAPSSPGWHPISIRSASESQIQQVGDFLYIYPDSIPSFTVEAVPFTAEQSALFTFNLKLNQPINSNMDPTTKGRILIDFPVGPYAFQPDLGTGLQSGQHLGCVIDGLSTQTALNCRLILSAGKSLPSAIEIVGFTSIAAGTSITIYLANVTNPSSTLGEYIYTLRTEHIDIDSGSITPIEYTTYSLWQYIQPIDPSVQTVQAPSGAQIQSGSALGQPERTLSIDIYSTLDIAIGDYYVYQIPTDLQISSTIASIKGITTDLQLAFSAPGWIVLRFTAPISAGTSVNIFIQTVDLPNYFPQQGYVIKGLLWKNEALAQIILFNTNPVSGDIINVALSMDSQLFVMNRTKVDFTIGFTTTTPYISSNGSIEIQFPSGFVPHANCLNLNYAGSELKTSTGRIACSVQNSSWIITNFDQVKQTIDVKIYGLVDLPNSSGDLGTLKIFTYANQDPNIGLNGLKIDSTTNGYNFTIANVTALALDPHPATIVNTPILAQDKTPHPLVFDFTLATAVSGGSMIDLVLNSTGGAFANSFSQGVRTICYFVNTETSEVIACDHSSTTTATVVTHSLTPLETLDSNVNHRGVITTAFADNGADGFLFPQEPTLYTALLRTNGQSSSQADLTFFEIPPNGFQSLKIKNYLISKPDDDIIDIDLQVASQINVDDRIVVEFPTNFNDSALFDDDLGQGLIDGQNKSCDVLTSQPASLTMQCFFQSGNQLANTPTSVIIHGFNQAFTQVRFAFTFKAPKLANSTILPLMLYVLQGAQSYTKSFYQYVDQAIVVLASASAPQASPESTLPSYSPSTFKTSSTLSISVNPNQNLLFSDYYVIKVPQMSLNAASLISSGSTSNQASVETIILATNGYIIINPSSSLTGNTLHAFQIPNVFTPDMPLSSNNMTLTGFVAYFSTMTAQKISYTSPSFQVLDSFPFDPKVSLPNQFLNQNSVITFTINAGYRGVRSAIIQFPPGIQVGPTCYEALNSNINVESCITDIPNKQVLITLEDKDFPAATTSLAIRVETVNGDKDINLSAFTYSLYSTVQTNPSQTASLIYKATINSSITLQSPNGGAGGPRPTYIEFEYVPYLEVSNGAQGLEGASDDLSFSTILNETLLANDIILITFTQFNIKFDNQNLGDVSSKPAVIISSGTRYSLVVPRYNQNSRALQFSIPSTMVGVLTSGTKVNFRITQVATTGDTIGVSTDIQSKYQYSLSMQVYNSTGQLKTPYPPLIVNHKTKLISTTTAPIRIKFQLVYTLAAGSGRVVVNLPANQFNFDPSSVLTCSFRAYTGAGPDYSETAATCTFSGSYTQGFTIQANTTSQLPGGVLYELILGPTNTNNPNFDVFNGITSRANIGFANGFGFIGYAVVDVNKYQQTPFASLTDFYFTSLASGTPNTLILSVTSTGKINNYPSTIIEIELSSANSYLITSGVTASNPEIKCGIVGLSPRKTSNTDVRCIMVNSSPPRVRIENYDVINESQNFYIMLYSLDNTRSRSPEQHQSCSKLLLLL